MANFTPAGNIQIATVAGFLSAVIEHLCKANGIIIPDDISAGLPAVVALGVAWIVDIVTDQGKAPTNVQSPPPPPAK